MSEQTELKPCPFCGGMARFECNLHGWTVLCGEGIGRCQVESKTASFTTAPRAIAAWNTRQPDRFNEGLEAAAKAAHHALTIKDAGYVDENQQLLSRAEREMKLEVHKAIRQLKEPEHE